MVCTSVRSQIAPHVHLISVAINRICAPGGSDQAEILIAGHHRRDAPGRVRKLVSKQQKTPIAPPAKTIE
jgi:hypothetical protein